MADQPRDFATLVELARTQSEDAARELVRRYGHHLLEVIRRRLHQRLRVQFDSADFVQAVWASFFALPPDKYQFDGPQALAAFLTNLARNKVVDAVRQRCQTLKNGRHHELHLPDADSPALDALPGGGPTPSEIAIAREEWQRLLEHQPEHYRRILESLRAGLEPQDVAERLGVSERTVRRVATRATSRGTP